MPHELIMYFFIIILAGVLSLFLCLYALRKLKEAPGAKHYIFVTLLSSIFTFSYAFELTSKTLEQIKFWNNVEYLVMPFIPVFVLFMSMEYIGQKIKTWLYYILFVIPVIIIFMHDTNELHHLFYTSVGLRSDAPIPILKMTYGPFFYVHAIFLFSCLMISVIVLLMQLKKAIFRFQIQILMMVAGIIIPIIANHFYLNGLSPYGIDLGPVSLSVSYLFQAVALLSFQMFNVAPIARDKVFEDMETGVVVLNKSGVIIDFNESMKKVLPILNKRVIGKRISGILDENEELANIIFNKLVCDYEVVHDGEIMHYNIRFSPVRNKKNIEIGQIITFANVTERVNLQKKLQHLASIDGLTQVLNRTFFMKKLDMLFKSRIVSGGNMTVIMFDIDHFKKVNDTYGHEAGDLILMNVSKLVKDNLRASDVIGRYGGEEFIICLPDLHFQEAYKLVDRIREKISQTLHVINSHEIYITSSFGVASTRLIIGNHTITSQSLVREADKALYIAKNNGRNRVEIYEHEYELINI